MASTDAAILREARLFEDELNGVYRRRLKRLRSLLDSLVSNMLGRCENADITITYKNRHLKAALWLHSKSYDQTFRDWGASSSRTRTRRRIEALLKLCGGDKQLLQSEYALALDKYFPIQSKSYRWAPKLIVTDSGHVTMVHRWGRVKVMSSEVGER